MYQFSNIIYSKYMQKVIAKSIFLYIGWTTSLLASAASFYFIEILGKPAAPLCWFERMLMFGLLLIFTVGIIRRDHNLKYYAIPFLILGIPSAAFQQAVHWNIIKLPLLPCNVGIVCTTKFFELFGFITQATLCLTAFLVIALCLTRIKPKKI